MSEKVAIKNNETNKYWHQSGGGYVDTLEEAGLFELNEAQAVCDRSSGTFSIEQPTEVSELQDKLDATYHLLNHIHREVCSLEDFDAESLKEEIEKTLNGVEIFNDNKKLHKEIEAQDREIARLRQIITEFREEKNNYFITAMSGRKYE